MEAVKSKAVYRFVKKFLVDPNDADKCLTEIIWTCAIYGIFSIVMAVLFYSFVPKSKSSRRLRIMAFGLFLLLQFYLLQTPFYIFQIGTNYNCVSDGQTGMAVMVSSMLVSFALLPFGIVFDSLMNRSLHRN